MDRPIWCARQSRRYSQISPNLTRTCSQRGSPAPDQQDTTPCTIHKARWCNGVVLLRCGVLEMTRTASHRAPSQKFSNRYLSKLNTGISYSNQMSSLSTVATLLARLSDFFSSNTTMRSGCIHSTLRVVDA